MKTVFLRTEQRQILNALRHGPLGPTEIADQTALAPFCVRGWLKELKRDRLVEEQLTTREHHYRLSDRGYRTVLAGDQLRAF